MPRGHGREIVDVKLAMFAEALLAIAFHQVPFLGTGAGDAQGFNLFGQGRGREGMEKVHKDIESEYDGVAGSLDERRGFHGHLKIKGSLVLGE